MKVSLRLFALLTFAASCGGLKYKINDALIADVPVAERGALLAIKDEQTAIKMNRQKTRYDRDVAERDLEVARADAKIAKLGVDKVNSDLDLARRTTDVNRIERAKVRLKVAELARSTAETKVAWRRLRLQYADQQLRVLRAEQFHAEARYEQEKARLAAQRGKTPYAKFDLSQFELQVAETQTPLARERVEAHRLRQELIQIEASYQAQKQQLEAARSIAPSQAVPPAPPLAAPIPSPAP